MHSFISSVSVRKHAFPTISMDHDLSVSTPISNVLLVDRGYVNCLVAIDDHQLLADLHVMSIKDFDVILGMDWLSSTHAVVDCHGKRVDFRIPRET